MAARFKLRSLLSALPVGATSFAACYSMPPELQKELDKLRPQEAALREKWTKDELEGSKKLPPRAWPTYQPKAEEIEGIRARIEAERCPPASSSSMSQSCVRANFDLASGLVFAAVDQAAGLDLYQKLASSGDQDSMVATGVCYVEGLGTERDDSEGVQWLRKATDLGSAQGAFDLGVLYFSGGASLDEDEARGFKLFEQAAAQKHVGGMFMVADCLLEEAGCEANADKSRVVPLLHAAAVSGHRGARQYLRMMWDGKWQSYA